MSISYLSAHVRRLMIAQAAILFGLLVFIVYRHYNPQTMDIDMSKCSSEYASYSDGEFYFDETAVDSDSAVDALVVNDISVPAGSYTLNIDYDCISDMQFALYDGTYSNAYLHGDTGWLRSTGHSGAHKFRTAVDLTSLMLKIKYEPNGYLSIKKINIVSNTDKLKALFAVLLGLFALFDCICLYKESVKENMYIILGITGSVLLSSMPLFMPGIAEGHDLTFALLRIESIYRGLSDGVFPVRMSSVFLRGYGYPVSVYYGDIFLYIPAVLRMLGFSVLECWKQYIFLINLATAFIGYCSFKKICGNRYMSLVMVCAYLTSPYRLYNLYVRAACGEFTAMTFYPLIALAVYKIYTESLSREKQRRYSTLMALGVSAVVCSHVLSTEILCFVLLLLALLLYRKTFTRRVFMTFVWAAVKTLIISAYFLVPFLDYYFTVPAAINDTVSNSVKIMQEAGAYLNDYFVLNKSLFSSARAAASPGIALIICLIAGMALYLNNRQDEILGITLLMSAIILLAATNLFPWDYIIVKTFIGRILSQIQLPTRFIGIATVFMVIAAYRVALYEKSLYRLHIYLCLVIAGSILTVAFFTNTYERERTIVSYYNTSDLDSMNVGRAEYALNGTNIYDDTEEVIYENNRERDVRIDRNGAAVTVSCKASQESAKVLVPLYDYKGFHAYDSEGNEYTILKGSNNLISFWIPAGYEGKISVKYRAPWYWNAALILSVAGTAAIIYPVKKRERKQEAVAVTKDEETVDREKLTDASEKAA